jgi:tetratricopeptide (TPR) repeat protein
VHLLAPLLAALAAADALGTWTANGARLDLKDEGGKVVGRLAAAGGPCDLAAGTDLLHGTLLQRAEAYNGVGVAFHARGDLDEALAWYKRALEADPRFGDAFYNMGCAYALGGQRDLAFRYLRMAALNRYSEREQMEKDPDLEDLHDDPQWTEILDQMDK